MKPVAIITATPPSVNPGMLACEAAAHSFVRRAGLMADCTFFRVRQQSDVLRHLDPALQADILAACDIGIQFCHLTDAGQLEGMVPVFWGDFLHMRAYHNALARADDPLFSPIVDLLLLRNQPALLRRAVSYGTSFLFNSTADYADPCYGPAFQTFFENAFHVQMRDAISAAVVAGMRRHPQNCCGIDPAQLLSLPAYESAVIGDHADDAAANRLDRAAVFFARGKHDWQRLEPFLEQLLATIGVRPEWIPWGDTFSFPFMENMPHGSRFPTLQADRPNCSRLQSLLRTIRESRCVITDTYHLGVISWAIGVPAIMIPGDYHDGERVTKGTNLRVRHDKRKVIMSQDRLLDFYIEPYLIASPECWHDISERLSHSVQTAEHARNARTHLAAKATTSETALLTAIKEARVR